MNIHRIEILSICLILITSLLSSLAYAERDKNERRDKQEYRDKSDHRDKSNYRDKSDRRDKSDYREKQDSRYSNKKTSYDEKIYRHDVRYQHDRYYPRSGITFKVLPSRYKTIHYRNTNYYFYDGIWYKPFGASFVVTVPPFGIVVPVLPAFYTTIWYNRTPYYYANDVYYVWRPSLNGYVVAEPPPAIVNETQPVMADELFIYPKQGQTKQTQADDRYECHSWGKSKTNYDPTKPPLNLSVSELNQKREEYQRAMRACLEGRGYSVR